MEELRQVRERAQKQYLSNINDRFCMIKPLSCLNTAQRLLILLLELEGLVKESTKKSYSLNDQEKEHNEYLSTIRKMRDYAQEQFDKLIVYLSSGGLVLTLGFVRDLVDLDEAICKVLMIASWVGFIMSLFLILLSHKSAIKSSTLELAEKQAESDEQDKKTNLLNNWSFGFLIAAVIAFVIFFTINL